MNKSQVALERLQDPVIVSFIELLGYLKAFDNILKLKRRICEMHRFLCETTISVVLKLM